MTIDNRFKKRTKYNTINTFSWIRQDYYKKIIKSDDEKILDEILLNKLKDNVEMTRSSFGGLREYGFEQFLSCIYRQIQIGKKYYAFTFDFSDLLEKTSAYFLSKKLYTNGFSKQESYLFNKRYRNRGMDQYGIAKDAMVDLALIEFDNWIRSQWSDNPAMDNYKHRVSKSGVIDKSGAYKSIRDSKANLKEFYHYRYKTTVVVLARDKNTIFKAKMAISKWIGKRFSHEFDDYLDNTKFVNLKNEYIDFLGYRLRVKYKNNKWIVKTQINPDLKNKYYKSLKSLLKHFLRGSSKRYIYSIEEYNRNVYDIHSYYKFVTNVSLDLRDLHYRLIGLIDTEFNKKGCKISKNGKISEKSKYKKYNKSSLVRYITSSGQFIIPIGFVSFKTPMFRNKKK